eukprot:14943757-Alexandrium_andersonii.AAC.1
MAHAPPSLLACLQCWPAWQAQLIADLELPRQVSPRLHELPHPSAALGPWMDGLHRTASLSMEAVRPARAA